MQIRIVHCGSDPDALAAQLAGAEDAALCVVQHVSGSIRYAAVPTPHFRTALHGRLFVRHARLACEVNEHLVEIVTDRRPCTLEAAVSQQPAALVSIAPPTGMTAQFLAPFGDDGIAQQLLAARYGRDEPLLWMTRRLAAECAGADSASIDDNGRIEQMLVTAHNRQRAFAAEIARCSGRTLAHQVELFARLRRVQALLDGPFYGDMTVPRMAEHANMTLFHFIRTWKRVFGDTPHRSLAVAKIGMATQLLRESSHTVGAVGQMLGFEDRCAFARWYRNETGRTASETRNEAAAEARGEIARVPGARKSLSPALGIDAPLVAS
jgi:AraC-like DNA-binding protein